MMKAWKKIVSSVMFVAGLTVGAPLVVNADGVLIPPGQACSVLEQVDKFLEDKTLVMSKTLQGETAINYYEDNAGNWWLVWYSPERQGACLMATGKDVTA